MDKGVLLVAGGAILGAILLIAVALRRASTRAAIRDRLNSDAPALRPPPGSEPPSTEFSDDIPFVRRHAWIPWLLGLAVSLLLYFAMLLAPAYAIVPGLIVGLIGAELDRQRVLRRLALIDSQLADAIDLMVGALQAGGGLIAAMESAARESRWPLQPQLAEVLGRIRLGDDPQTVFRALTRRVPTENFSLFASALAVHWEVGGSLAGSLSMVGRTIRDRIELSRRVSSLTTQGRASVAAVMLATYFIAAVIWRNNTERMELFLASTIGSWLVGFAILLQAVGIVWTATASRIRY